MHKNTKTFFIAGIIFLSCLCNIYSFTQEDNKKTYTWQEMMDSCNAYNQIEDYQSALNWAMQAEVKAKAELGELDTNYVSVLDKIGSLYYNIGFTEIALKYAELILNKNKQIYKTDNIAIIKSLYNLADVLTSLERIEDAVKISNEALEMSRRLFKDDNQFLAKSINNLAITFNNIGNFIDAEKYFNEALEMRKRIFKEDHPDLFESFLCLAEFYKNIGETKKSDQMLNDCLDMSYRIFYSDSVKLAKYLNSIGLLFNGLEKYDKAEMLFVESLEIYRRISNIENISLLTAIGNLANFYKNRNQFSKSEQLFLEALEKSRQLFKSNHPWIEYFLEGLARLYIEIEEYEKAEPLCTEALDMSRRIYNYNKKYLGSSIDLMSLLFYSKGEYLKAEPLINECLDINRQLYKTDHPNLAIVIDNTASNYHQIGNLQKAENLYIEALEMSRRLYKNDHQNLINIITNLADLYLKRGDYIKAEPLYNEALEMCTRLFKSDNNNVAAILHSMGIFYKTLGDYNKSEFYFNKSLEMFRRIYINRDSRFLSDCIIDLGDFYHSRNDLNKAKPLYIEALEMNRRIFKNDNIYLNKSINSLGTLYVSLNELNKSEPLLIEALEMSRRLYKSDHSDLAMELMNMGCLFYKKGEYDKSLPYLTESLEMFRRIYSTEHKNLKLCINNLAKCYFKFKDYKNAEPLYIENLNINKNIYLKQSSYLSQVEKEKFWNTMSGNFETFLSFVKLRYKENPIILGNAFDNLLFTKALQYNSANKIRKRILESNDSLLIAKYNEFTGRKEMLLKLYSLPAKELEKQGYNIDSLEKITNTIEKELSLKSEDFKQSYEKKKVSWKTIQAILKPDEAAVEVVRFRYYDKDRYTDTIYYAFLIVTNETEEHPELVLIEEGNKLEDEWYNEYRNLVKIKARDSVSFRRYWGKLHDKLKDFNKIYFSPDGIYNKLNPSTLKLPEGKFLLDIQDIQQVNSTNDLLLGYYQRKTESNLLNNAVLVGNPNFGLDGEKVVEETRKFNEGKPQDKYYEQLAVMRGVQLTRLPGTENEIKDIEKFLKAKNWLINTYTGDMAVKASVKNVNSPRILHIATHGLFLEDVKRSGKELFGFEEQKMVENPLLRSGLFFSGADNYIKKETPGYIEEDNGLLTAYEAMNLNLDKTELVVLSACETGLGEIQNGEGVFGLRRAFQQAGAKSVLMSLWKVSDDATQMLMSSFYRNWVSGMTKREAFARAQQEVRAKYPDPYYWGAFVMVGE